MDTLDFMNDTRPIPTIDLSNPHRSILGRLIEASGKPDITDLSAMKYVESLEPATRAAGEFLLECIHDTAELNHMGSWMVKNIFEESLQNHHQIATLCQSEKLPVIKAPVFILGLPRTGSSYLFNLLGNTQYFRTMRHWETQKIAGRKPDFLKRLEAAAMLKLMQHLSPGFRTVHEIRLDGPEECTRLLLNCFVCQSFPNIFHIPRYNDFLDTADYLPTYRFFNKQLQVLGSHNKRWLLKSPIHMQSVDSILEVFPDAKFIWLHREFEEVVCSICSLAAAYRGMSSYRHIPPEIGKEVRKYLTRDLAKGRAILDSNKDIVLELHYKQIVDQPVKTVKEIFSFVCGHYDDDIEHAVREEMKVSVPDKYGKHIYYEEDYFPHRPASDSAEEGAS
jgi:hypothetical protein